MLCMESNWDGRHDSLWDTEKNVGPLEVSDERISVSTFPHNLYCQQRITELPITEIYNKIPAAWLIAACFNRFIKTEAKRKRELC